MAQIRGAPVIDLTGAWPTISRFINSGSRFRTALRLQQSRRLLDRTGVVVARSRKKETRRFLPSEQMHRSGRYSANPEAG